MTGITPTPEAIATHLHYIRASIDEINIKLGPLSTHEDRITRIEQMLTRVQTGLIGLAVTVAGSIITYLIIH